MNYKQQSALCGVISCLILLTTYFSIEYVATNGAWGMEIPYGLSENYIVFQQEGEPANFSDIVDIEKDTNITLLSEYENKRIMALYDSAYYFYPEKMVNMIGKTRYFSKEDYEKKSSTGIFVSDKEDVDTAFVEFLRAKNAPVEEIIFGINPLSKLYRKDIDYILNLAEKEVLGERVYLDSSNLKDRNRVAKKLLEAGYVIENKKKTNMFKAVRLGFAELHEKAVIIPSMALYGIFLIVCSMSFYNNQHIIKVHQRCGGTKQGIFLYMGKRFFRVNIAGSVLMLILYGAFFEMDVLGMFGIKEYILIMLLHIIVTTFFYYQGYYLNYRKKGDVNNAL